MCDVILNKNNINIDFIIYNILFAKSNYYFTTDELLNKVKKYDPQVSIQTVQTKIDSLVREGLIRQKLKQYYIVT